MHMNELEQPQLPVPQNHTWIFVLLLCAIMLMIGVFGFAIFSIYSDIDSTEVQEEVLPESPDETTEEVPAQTEPETPSTPSAASYKSYAGLPSFEFPLSWHVLVQTGGGYYDNNILLNDQPIRLCEGCDGPVFPITITDYAEGFEDAPTEQMLKDGFRDHITGQLPADLKEQRTTLPNGRLYSVSGTTPDALYAPHFEELLLFTGTDGNVIYVHYTDIDSSGTFAAIWQHLKETLSFVQN